MSYWLYDETTPRAATRSYLYLHSARFIDRGSGELSAPQVQTHMYGKEEKKGEKKKKETEREWWWEGKEKNKKKEKKNDPAEQQKQHPYKM